MNLFYIWLQLNQQCDDDSKSFSFSDWLALTNQKSKIHADPIQSDDKVVGLFQLE